MFSSCIRALTAIFGLTYCQMKQENSAKRPCTALHSQAKKGGICENSWTTCEKKTLFFIICPMMLNRCAFESRDQGASFELYSTSIRHFPASLRPLEKQKFGKTWPKRAKGVVPLTPTFWTNMKIL